MSLTAVNAKLCQGKDVLERMNYLYQASRLMAKRSNNQVAASYYGNIMVGCAKKAVLRMTPDMKRTVCKCCQSPLIPGKTAKVRLVSKPTKMVKWTCLTCSGTRRIPTKKGYKLWADQPEALVELFDYAPKPNEDKNEKINETDNCVHIVDCKIAGTAESVENCSFVTEEKVSSDADNILGQDGNQKKDFLWSKIDR